MRNLVKSYANIPISRHFMLDLLAAYKRPNDKISELINSGELISLKRGLYVAGPNSDLPQPEPFSIANYLRGPSYVSMESALSYWGMIPERTYEVSSATIKTTKKFLTEIGRYAYQQLTLPYYSFGIKRVELTPTQSVLIASPEKALCDKIILTSNINLRSCKQTKEFLLEDLRIDEDILRNLDVEMINSWLEAAPKKNSLKMLIKSLKDLC